MIVFALPSDKASVEKQRSKNARIQIEIPLFNFVELCTLLLQNRIRSNANFDFVFAIC